MSWKKRHAGIRWPTEEHISAGGADVRGWLLDVGAVPVAWADAQSNVLPKSSSIGIEIHRPELPSAPFVGVGFLGRPPGACRGIAAQVGRSGGGVVQEGRADALFSQRS